MFSPSTPSILPGLVPRTIILIVSTAEENSWILSTSRRSPPPSPVLAFCVQHWARRAGLREYPLRLLLLVGCMACVPLEGEDPVSPSYVPITFGLVVMFNICTFGHISGAHMNPAVTLAAVVWGDTGALLGALYVAAQVGGALLGYSALLLVSPRGTAAAAACVTEPHAQLNSAQAFGVEVILTAVLVLLCCGVWDAKARLGSAEVRRGGGRAVPGRGAAVRGQHEPSRSLAPALLTNSWTRHWVYWVGPLMGSALAVSLYKYALYKKPKVPQEQATIEY
ncbi:unnamed protein product [Plutella xylostella]|uniref:(diamondback moth) hypothetical protein n=1 Tax=Plutella xylostella TaxID=51655 RepID=A0A8S4G2M2_PLUXY|nr:unnamed protein product [Plutella xylostella]